MHPSRYRPDLHPIAEPLYVLTMLSNPLRWRNRAWNYFQFEREVEAAGAVLSTAEIALGERPFEVTQADNPHHLQLRTQQELWHKENALNLLMSRLPADAKYIAWIDADIQFARPDWVQETIQQLQHFPIVQMFSEAQDMGPGYATEREPAHSFGYCYQEQIPPLTSPGPLAYDGTRNPGGGVYWHPGFAWAARKDALSAVGGLMDFCIFGSADWHMAMALVGRANDSLRARYTDTYQAWIRAWERRAERSIRRDLGYVPGLILHHYHGAKSDRGYATRYSLMEHYDPAHDIMRDHQGLWQIDPENLTLRDDLRRYARARKEDG